MQHYWVEGIFITRLGLQRAKKRGKTTSSDLELFAKSIWANSPQEALNLANEELHGGQWNEPPKVTKTSEELRMRKKGAPELPLFKPLKQKKKG